MHFQSASMQHFPLRSSGRRILNYLDDWLILTQSLNTLISHIDLLLIHLESLGLCVNMQRTFSPPPLTRSRGDESLPLVRSCGDESPPLARSSRGQFVFPAPFQARQLCSVEGFSETARTQGSDVIWDYYTCARCSYGWNLESRGRRGLRDVSHRGHIEALTQPRSLQPGSSPVLGSVARDGHNGCLTELLEAPPWPIPGRKHMLSQVDGSVWHSNLELRSHHVWSLQGYQRRWAPYSLACSHAHGSANTHYKTFVCFKMGSVCERVRIISTRLLAPYRMFWVSRCTDWIVDRYHRHWSLCRGHCRIRSPQSGQSFGKKDYIPHVHFRFHPGTRKWVKSFLTATIWAFNIHRFEGAIP